MTLPRALVDLRHISQAPQHGTAEYITWLQHADFLEWLDRVENHSEIFLSASLPHVFLFCVSVPERALAAPNPDDLLKWGCDPTDTWGVSYGTEARLEPPLRGCASAAVAQDEQLLFARRFEGRSDEADYFELLQPLIHTLGIHYVPERSAYCRFDKHGEIEDVARAFVGRKLY